MPSAKDNVARRATPFFRPIAGAPVALSGSLLPVTLKSAIKGAILPRGCAPRTVPFGIARGLRMQIDFAHQTRIYLGLYEIELDRFLRRMLCPGLAAFDVGAQHGYDSLAIAKRTQAPVAAFECDGVCLAHMRESFALNPEVSALIHPVHAFVGPGDDQVELDAWAYGEDGFVPDFIKLDIEGGEVDALRSATRILTERHPALIVEVHSLALEREAGEILIGHGYRPVVVSQRRILRDLRPTAHNRWLVAAS